MHARRVVGLVLSILTFPVLALGIFDPMEGGLAMLVAGVLILATWLVSRVPVPRLEWIGWVATVGIGAMAIGFAVLLWNAGVTGPGGTGMPWWLVALIVGYEIGVVVTFAGGIWNLVRHIKVVRDHGIPVAGSTAH